MPIGVILTGMGDGRARKDCSRCARAGAQTIAQDEADVGDLSACRRKRSPAAAAMHVLPLQEDRADGCCRGSRRQEVSALHL